MNTQKTKCSNDRCLTNSLEPVTDAAKEAMQQSICTFCGNQRVYVESNLFEQVGRETRQARSQRANNLY